MTHKQEEEEGLTEISERGGGHEKYMTVYNFGFACLFPMMSSCKQK